MPVCGTPISLDHAASAIPPGGVRAGVSRFFWSVSSPRVLVTLLVGFGATGTLLAPRLGGAALVGVAIGGALVFELGIVGPLWRSLLRFGSEPALTVSAGRPGSPARQLSPASREPTFPGLGQYGT